MKKDKRNVLILISILVVIVFTSYFIFSSGITNKLSANVLNDDLSSIANYPVINLVVNSSGEKYVNDDVTITVNASSYFNITNLEYSFDLKNWKTIYNNIGSKKINKKITFSKTMNETLYIRVINEKGYKSYAYKTFVKIDKVKPSLKIVTDNDSVVINTQDNVGLSSVQYSNDLVNWQEESIDGEKIILRKENFDYKYIRVVDIVGNISDIKEVK